MTTHSVQLVAGLNEFSLVEWGVANSYVLVTLKSQTPLDEASAKKSVQVAPGP